MNSSMSRRGFPPTRPELGARCSALGTLHVSEEGASCRKKVEMTRPLLRSSEGGITPMQGSATLRLRHAARRHGETVRGAVNGDIDGPLSTVRRWRITRTGEPG